MALAPTLIRASGVLPLLTAPRRAVARRRGAAISGYVGPNGSGKSWLIAHDTLPTLAGVPWYCTQPDHVHTMNGITSGTRHVLSTMGFSLPDGRRHPLWTPLTDWAQLVNAEHVDLVLDEVAGVASSRDSHSLPSAVGATLQELRRRDVICRWSAPGWMRADKLIREPTQAVTLCLGFMPVPERGTVEFPDAHADCDIAGPHDHPNGREWSQRRLLFARTFDANTFDEWTTAKRESVRPLVRALYWIPGSAAAGAYDTLGEVLKMGQITDAGMCVDCGGSRPRQKCACDQRTMATLKARWASRAGSEPHDLDPVDGGAQGRASAPSTALPAPVADSTAEPHQLWAPPAVGSSR